MARTDWNHVPEELPIRVMPLWERPLRPLAVLRWYWDSWFPISVSLVIVGLAFAAWAWLSPSLEEAKEPGLWIGLILLRNLILIAVLAQGLHLIFHRYALQGRERKYDRRPFPRKGRVFTFEDQYWDNVFWTLASGVPIWSAYEALIFWSMANGYAPVWNWSDGWFWYLAIFFLIPIWESFYFYWIHRLLHTDAFYRFHALHHRNTDVGPWSGLSMHPVEHVLFFGTALIHFVAPTHPVHLICHLMFYALFAVTTHTGFEGLTAGGRLRLKLGTFHHQLHHRFFEVNYGSLEVPWDKLFGTFHDGTDAAGDAMKQRLREKRRG